MEAVEDAAKNGFLKPSKNESAAKDVEIDNPSPVLEAMGLDVETKTMDGADISDESKGSLETVALKLARVKAWAQEKEMEIIEANLVKVKGESLLSFEQTGKGGDISEDGLSLKADAKTESPVSKVRLNGI